MMPDYESAALKAAEILIRFGIKTAPVDPLPVLKQLPGVFVLSFEEMSEISSISRSSLLCMCGENSQDAVTTVNVEDDRLRYLVAFNQKLPSFVVQRALARELGHIVLGHDGSKPEDVRTAEAVCFANHLLCPRPLIHSIQSTGIRITTEVLGNLTGCYEYCLSCMRRIPSVHVPAELNRIIRDNFMPYILNFFEYQRIASSKDGSSLADFGTYMDGYEE